MIGKAIYHSAPLVAQPYAILPLGAVRPMGWLKEQLLIQSTGLSGHLCEIWPDQVGEDCAWLGGEGDAWERAPYYLDGLVPLAHLLKDQRLLDLVDRYITWILHSQREDGSFGPANQDWWPRMVVCKALMQAYTATGDAAIPKFMLRYFAYQFQQLDTQPLSEWAIPRAAEGVLCVLWLHGLTGKGFLLKLAKKLLQQGFDWTGIFHSFPYTRDMKKVLPWETLKEMREHPATPEAAAYAFGCYHQTHVVNLAMALKNPALAYAMGGGLKEAQAGKIGWERLIKGHGVAGGMFTGDEHLSGSSPSQGTETCAVVESMFSMETLLWLTGDPCYGDMLEKLAFGALPAAMTADMWGHQYDQQVNQVLVSKANRDWYNNQNDANLFGFAPNFGCCTANYHQGLPKFAASLWMEVAGGGLAAQSYAPCKVRWQVGGQSVGIEVSGGYPNQGEVRIQIDAKVSFPLHLRIPAWAKDANCLLNGRTIGTPIAGEYLVLDRTWEHGDVITLSLPMVPRITRWSHQTAAVERGPVLYALKIQEEWTRIAEHPLCDTLPDWQVEPRSPWNYALLIDQPILDRPCESAPSNSTQAPSLFAKAVLLPDWKLKNASAALPPVLPKVDPAKIVEIELVPYGSTALRIGQFPVGRLDTQQLPIG